MEQATLATLPPGTAGRNDNYNYNKAVSPVKTFNSSTHSVPMGAPFQTSAVDKASHGAVSATSVEPPPSPRVTTFDLNNRDAAEGSSLGKQLVQA